MNIPHTYLELLEKKGIPAKRRDIEIAFKRNNNDDVLNSTEMKPVQENEKDEMTEEIVTEEHSEQMKLLREPKKISIVDKRASANIDRELVMEKLRQLGKLPVYSNKLSIPKTQVPIVPYMEKITEPSAIKLTNKIVIDEAPKFSMDVQEEEEPADKEDKETPLFPDISEPEPNKEIEEKQEEEKDETVPQEPTVDEIEEIDEPIQDKIELTVQEPEPVIIPVPKKRGRKPKVKQPVEDIDLDAIDLTTAVIRSQKITDRLPKDKEKNIIMASPYYLNNRKMFVSKLRGLFEPRRQELMNVTDEVSCDRKNDQTEFDLLTHQKIVRDYLNLYTPYRGLLLYHGLGSGKTCTSIAIAEGMKHNKQVVVMTPASLKMNFFSEMKKCGDDLYRKDQYWDFVSIEGNTQMTGVLSRALSLPVEFIREQGGAWFLNVKEKSNFAQLNAEQQTSIDDQLNQMIRAKYKDINYNGLNKNSLLKLTDNMTKNPFDNSVVIIDEAHNFVSRVVNKIKKPDSIAYVLYDYLMKATNARIVLLSGTPIINYPNEIGVLFNILRGYIKTWTFPVQVQTNKKVNTDTILEMLDKGNMRTFDYVNYSNNVLTVTRNPFGFINAKKRGALKKTHKERPTKPNTTRKKPQKGGDGSDVFDRYDGVRLDDAGNISDEDFMNKIVKILQKNQIEVLSKKIKVDFYKSLPDVSDEFISTFVDGDKEEAKNVSLFQRRILGLTSYFRSAQEELLPKYEETEQGDIYHVEKCEMSDHQFDIYEKIRKVEADKEKQMQKRKKKQAKGDELFNISSSYRIFSRAACNFVFPNEIERPTPGDTEVNENILDMVPAKVAHETDSYADAEKLEEVMETTDMNNYGKRIQHALDLIAEVDSQTNKSKYLSGPALAELSPKFQKILLNLIDEQNKGLHLVYSNFRTIEGIGILRLMLLANGFAEFKLTRREGNWEIDENEEDVGKPRFVLYTGTESAEEKEIVRNIYNGSWNLVPTNIAEQLRKQNENNMYGEIIKVFMITSSGAEGINLKNTRYVHIVEPYWHMVRPEQVVGRARRICSHQDLPVELRTVKVFLYVSAMSDAQKKDEKHIVLRLRDVSRLDKETPITTDENLYEIASSKQKINNQILQAVKETAVDCNVYSSLSTTDKPVVCYGFGKVESNSFASYPSFEVDKIDKEVVSKIQWTAQEITFAGKTFALRTETMEVYDMDSYKQAVQNPNMEPTLVGKLIKEDGKYKIEYVKA
jgi:hypothetical protein